MGNEVVDGDPAQAVAVPDTRSPRPASRALTKTGGFLAGFSHTLQPYIGCRFGCDYCYVQGSPVHLFHQPKVAWGEYAHPRSGIDVLLARELARLRARGRLNGTTVFMSSSTDPYQPGERTWRLSRRCLDVFAEYPPGLLLVQTRSPLVEDDFARLAAIGPACWLSITIETDCDDVRRALTPRCAAIARRWEIVRKAKAAGIPVQITVSPCLPFSSVASFGAQLVEAADRVVVDTFVSGDGAQGRRTAASGIPARYEGLGYADWRSEEAARALFELVSRRMGARAGWSQAGFTTLTQA